MGGMRPMISRRWLDGWASRSKLKFTATSLVSVSFVFLTDMPGLSEGHPLEIAFFLEEDLIGVCSLTKPGWTRVRLEIPDALRTATDETFEFKIYASRIFQPSLVDPNSVDDRELSIAVHDIEVKIQD